MRVKTTGRHELARHARFAEISPAVGVLDEQALHRALADDPTAFELLAAMTTATDENLRAAAIRLCAALVLERARAGPATTWGVSRLRPVRGASGGDLDIDASVEGVSAARAEARPVTVDDLTTVQWARAPTAFAVVVDRSGSMNGARLAADTVETARALPELIILAPADDHAQAAQLASQAGARWAAIEHPLDAAAVLDRLLRNPSPGRLNQPAGGRRACQRLGSWCAIYTQARSREPGRRPA